MFISKAEFTSHIYEENLNVISRDDDTKVTSAISAAMEEATGYMSRFDFATLFAALADDRDPILMMYIKDIAKWHFINICNASVDLELAESRYKKAIAWLDKVQSGKVVPRWPLAVDETTANSFHIRSSTKRGNYY